MNFPFTEHPCLPAVTREVVVGIVQKYGAQAPAVLQQMETKRREAIALAKRDPLRHGWELEWWKEADALLAQKDTILLANLGGNGSAKTTHAVKRALQVMFDEPGSKVLFLHESDLSSRMVHQKYCYDYLPPEVRPTENWKPKKGVNTRIAYNIDTGFIGSGFSLPNGSSAVFGFYTQDVKIYEGTAWRIIVLDEDAPLSWIDTLLYRLGRAGGKAIWCFTAIKGITPAVHAITAGAKTLRSRPVDPELLPVDHQASENQDWPRGHMPFVQESPREGVKIIYAHSDMNPLSGYDPERGLPAWHGYREIVRLSKGKPVAERERRAYGFSRQNMRTVFPRFSASHIVPVEKMAEILKKPCTRYLVCDPAGNRNFFFIWFAVDQHGRHFVYREWPDVPTFGQWALPSEDSRKWDGIPGPAQQTLGYGVKAYKRMILEAEGWSQVDGVWVPGRRCRGKVLSGEVLSGEEGFVPAEEIFQRFIDPRSGAVNSTAEDSGESSLISRFYEEQRESDGTISGPSMEFEQAYSGSNEDDGLNQITEMLDYDLNEPITHLVNEPRLYVSAACQNLIWALTNYSQHDGGKAACKDPIDTLRYAVLKKCIHVQQGQLGGIAGGGW